MFLQRSSSLRDVNWRKNEKVGFYPLFYYFITSQYPEVLLPTRTIKPSFLSKFKRLFTVRSDKTKSSLNCLIVMFGFCMINSNVLWAIFGQSLGNLCAIFMQSLCNLCAIFMQVLLLLLQSYHISNPSCIRMLS